MQIEAITEKNREFVDMDYLVSRLITYHIISWRIHEVE